MIVRIGRGVPLFLDIILFLIENNKAQAAVEGKAKEEVKNMGVLEKAIVILLSVL